MYNQRDKKWANVKIGQSNSSIGNYGCLLCCLSEFYGEDPIITNKKLTSAGAYNVDIVRHDVASKALGLEYAGFGNEFPGYETIAEVDFSVKEGKQQHFVIDNGKTILDPWTGEERPRNTYKILSYRLYQRKNKEVKITPITKNLKSAIEEVLHEDYGDNFNENEQKKASEQLIGYVSGLENSIDELKNKYDFCRKASDAQKENEKNLNNSLSKAREIGYDLQKEIDNLKIQIQGYEETFTEQEETIKDLEKKLYAQNSIMYEETLKDTSSTTSLHKTLPSAKMEATEALQEIYRLIKDFFRKLGS